MKHLSIFKKKRINIYIKVECAEKVAENNLLRKKQIIYIERFQCIRVYACIYVYIYIYIYIYIFIYIYMFIYICVCVCVYGCVHACTCAYRYIYIYIYIYRISTSSSRSVSFYRNPSARLDISFP